MLDQTSETLNYDITSRMEFTDIGVSCDDIILYISFIVAHTEWMLLMVDTFVYTYIPWPCIIKITIDLYQYSIVCMYVIIC